MERTPVSFAASALPNVSCTGEVCHQPFAYATLVDKPSQACCDQRAIVRPLHPSQSHLVEALLGTSPCVERMPPGGELSPQVIDDIVAWICQGAPNN